MDQELLFILIIIITVAINIYKAIQKKKEQAGKSAAPSPPITIGKEEDFQEVLRRMFEQRAEADQGTEQEAEGSMETLVPMGGSMESLEGYEFQAPEYTKSSLTMEGFDVTPSILAAEEPEPAGKDFAGQAKASAAWQAGHKFDLKTAVIYNAILNKPYN